MGTVPIEVGKYYIVKYDSHNSNEKFVVYIRDVDDYDIKVSVCSNWIWCPLFYSLTPYWHSLYISHTGKTFTKYEPTRLERFFGLVRSKKLFGESA